MKHLLILLLLSAGFLFAAGETLSMGTHSAWQRINGKGELTCVKARRGGEIFTVRGKVNYRSLETLPVSPDKFYKLSGDFKAAPGSEPAAIYFGIIPFDADMKQIGSGEVNVINGTATVLTRAAAEGDTILQVADASSWKEGSNCAVAFNAAGDFSDLPNRTLVSIVKINKTADGYEITLKKPLTNAYPAGCPVRQHQHGSTYPYNAAAQKVSGKWQNFSVLLNGEALTGVPHVKWWHGTRNAAIIMLVNYGGDDNSEMLVKNVMLEELTR